MRTLKGATTITVDAPIDRAWEAVCRPDIGLTGAFGVRPLEVHEQDDAGRPTLATARAAFAVVDLAVDVAFAYDEAGRLTCHRVGGDLDHLEAVIGVEARTTDRTDLHYEISVGFGRRTSLVLRGPIAAAIRHYVIHQRPREIAAAIARDDERSTIHHG